MAAAGHPCAEWPAGVGAHASGPAPDGSARQASDRKAEAQQALELGERALRDERPDAAIRWLDRAWRLARDPAAGLLLAAALLEPSPSRAAGVLAEIVAGHPQLRDAQVALAAARFREGDHDAAARLLGGALAGHAAPRTPGFAAFADALAAAAGHAGWVGADTAGRITVSLASGSRAAGGAIGLAWDTAAATLAHLLATRRLATSRLATYRLPPEARRAASLRVTCDGRDLLGSPIALRGLRRIEGVVQADADGGVSGCVWVAGDPDAVPVLTLAGATQSRSVRIRGLAGGVAGAPFARRFRLAPGRLPAGETLRVLDRDGGELLGSPILRAPTLRAPTLRAPTLPKPAPPPARPPRRPPVDIVIPVWRGAGDLAACLASLRRLPPGTRIVIVDDASDDPALREFLASPACAVPACAVPACAEAACAEAACAETIVLRQDRRRGFPAAANAGLRLAAADASARRDVLLLNPDTLLPPDAVARLADAAYAAADIGSVTPMSHDGTIVSCDWAAAPGATPAESIQAVDHLDACFAAANPGHRVELPTGIGFCLFLRHDCLAATGALREDVFAQGYGEENDWCCRARGGGWRHVADTGLFVAHAGGRSFGPARALLMARNAAILDRLHPGYAAAVQDFRRADPLREARRRAAAAWWAAGRRPDGAAILVSHALGGGTEQRVLQRAGELAAQGLRPIVLRLSPLPPLPSLPGRQDAHACTLSGAAAEASADLRFALPAELPALAALLAHDRPHWLELHHCGGLPPDILDLARALRIPYDVAVHDYAMLCPRVTFCGADGRYCGEPTDVGQCASCVAAHGSRLHEAITVSDLRTRSVRILREARQVLVPCEDVARRLRRYAPALAPVVTAWEPQSIAPPRPTPHAASPQAALPSRDTRICVVGALGRDKGYDVLLRCAEEAARHARRLSFVVVGHTVDDARLLATGRAFVTGRFAADEADALVREQDADFGFVPSVCPETWSFALSTLWRAGLPAIGFDLGATAERIRRSGRGWVIPLGAPAAWINRFLLDLAARPIAPQTIFPSTLDQQAMDPQAVDPQAVDPQAVAPQAVAQQAVA